MATILPFRAVRPVKDLARQLASRPYDVLNRAEARADASANPHSFLHVTRAEIDLGDEIDAHSQPVYDKARSKLAEFLENGILFRDAKPCYYIYQLTMEGQSQTGLVCLSSLDEYEAGTIKKHELTRPEKELDRINHIKTTRAQTGNVFLAYKTEQRIHQLIEDWKASHHPEYDFIADDAVKHMIWVVDDEETINLLTTWFAEKIPATYIADGHHRAASAAKVRQALGSLRPNGANYFLTTLFPSDQLHILDYNRSVKDLGALSTEEFLQSLQRDFLVRKLDHPFKPAIPHEFGMYLAGSWYELVAKDQSYSLDPIGVLDVTILQQNILDRILDIRDPRTDKRVDFIGGIRGLGELESRVNRDEMKAAFSLHPVTIQQLFDIADSGEIMPPKSTWFEPKLRDGLLTHLID